MQQLVAVIAVDRFGQNILVDRDVALAAASGYHQVHGGDQLLVALHAGIFQRKPGRIGAEPLPVFHLALVAALRDLFRPVHGRQGMDAIGREGFAVDDRFRRRIGAERLPMMLGALAETGDEADAGDPYFFHGLGHRFGQLVPVSPAIVLSLQSDFFMAAT